MRWSCPSRRGCGALQSAAALVLSLLLACNAGDAAGPDDDGPGGLPGHPLLDPVPIDPQPSAPAPTTPPPNQPGPGAHDLAGAYMLTRVNQETPGQLITVANPDGSVVGQYRFSEGSMLGMTGHSWSLSLKYRNQQDHFVLEDEGEFARDGEEIRFHSARLDADFHGNGEQGSVSVGYDLDGDREPDLTLDFLRILPPGF